MVRVLAEQDLPKLTWFTPSQHSLSIVLPGNTRKRPNRCREKCAQVRGCFSRSTFTLFISVPVFSHRPFRFSFWVFKASASAHFAPDDVLHPMHAISLKELKRQTPAAKRVREQKRQ